MDVSGDLATRLTHVAERHGFSGAVRVTVNDDIAAEFATGHADRSNQRANTVTTRFGAASATKGFTALTIMSLVESGALSLTTTVRDVLGDALPTVRGAVTIDHLLTHRSGVGDYIDEAAGGDIDDYTLGALSPHAFVSPRDYLTLLNDYPQRTAPGTEFAYNNSGFVILSIVIEEITGSFHQAVVDRVMTPAGMESSGFFRSDNLPPETAIGYLRDGRTNIFHLPVIGAGDGGIYLTLDDADAFWKALDSGEIVSDVSRASMTMMVSDNGERASCGRGFWVGAQGDHVWLEGMDAGVSFQTGQIRSSGLRYTVMANTSAGAWPVVDAIVSTDNVAD